MIPVPIEPTEEYKKGYMQGCEDTEEYYIEALKRMMQDLKENRELRHQYTDTQSI